MYMHTCKPVLSGGWSKYRSVMAEEKHAVSGRPELPDLVIEQILHRLPTHAARRLRFLSKQWEGILCSAPTLDFDEAGADFESYKLEQQRHYMFINMLNKFLLECDENKKKQKQVMDKFRLRMTTFSARRDNMIVTKLLHHSIDRSVKEIDISTKYSGLQCNHRGWMNQNLYYGGFSRKNLVSVKSLTSLKLEYVRMRKLGTGLNPTLDTCLFPSLKNMFFKNVHFDDHATRLLFPECPAVEYLSLISCTYGGGWIHIPSSSLKFLEINRCLAKAARVHKAVNLESVTILSSDLKHVILTECCNLKHLDIQAPRLANFHLSGCHDVKGTINARNLCSFSFEGHLMKSKFRLRAPRLILARIISRDSLSDEESSCSFDEPWKHFPKLTDFLKQFGRSKEMILVLHDFKDLIFPKDFRKTLSSAILPKVEILDYWTNNIASASEGDMEDLTQSFRWMAPLANHITTKEYTEKWDLFMLNILNR